MEDYASVVRVSSLDDGSFNMVEETIPLESHASDMVLGFHPGDWVWDVKVFLGGLEVVHIMRETCSIPLRIVSDPWATFGEARDAVVFNNQKLCALIEELESI